jgi:hypothetical protein
MSICRRTGANLLSTSRILACPDSSPRDSVSQHSSGFDLATARLTQIGYAAVSLVSGDPLPSALMNTFMAHERHEFDGVFVLSKARVDRLVAHTEAIASHVELQKQLIVRTIKHILDAKPRPNAPIKMHEWASSVLNRLRRKCVVRGAVASEDVSTADYAEVVNGFHVRGEFVQVTESNFPAFISFGGLRVHFEGTMRFASGDFEAVTLRLSPALTDTFDFHTGDGTSWADHVFFRLQRNNLAKPFLIEGIGSPFNLIIHGSYNR